MIMPRTFLVIADNANLCIHDVQRLKSKFKGIPIYQSANCEVNSSLEDLSSIERINGSLLISDCPGLGRFDALRGLKEVTVPAGRQGPAIMIEGNPGLSSLDFPELSKIESSDDIKIRIVRNPSLTMKKALVENN
ncbi:receptor L domain protein, partial [Cooperia oncophora]